MEFSEVVSRRRMVRNYLPDPVDPAKLKRILRAATRGPSAGFSQGQSFVVVQNDVMRRRIAEIAGEPGYVAKGFNPWLSAAPVHVVCCTSESDYHRRYNEPDKLTSLGAERSWPVPFWYVDAGCSLMLLLLAAVDEGLAAGFLGLTEPATAELRALLEIAQDVIPVGLVTLGLPAPDRRSASIERGWKDEESVVRWV